MSPVSPVAPRKLGNAGPQVFPLALGCMSMSGIYGPADESESVATIHEALERGITLLDTGDFYGMGHNEMLIGRALRGRRDRALLSVKFGGLRGPDHSMLGFDARPVAVKNFLAYSLTRLGVDHVDIYRPARLDPAVPIEETIGAIADLVKAGYVRAIGLSEVGVETIQRAHAVHPICDLQIEYALISRAPEAKIFPLLAQLGIGVTAYGVLSRGLLSGSATHAPGDMRSRLPRFSRANREQNQRVVDTLNALAQERGATPTQLAIAWVLAKGTAPALRSGASNDTAPALRGGASNDAAPALRGGASLNPSIVPVIGARKRVQLAESLAALDVKLSPADLARIEAALPASAIAGTRYAEEQMRMLDSER